MYDDPKFKPRNFQSLQHHWIIFKIRAMSHQMSSQVLRISSPTQGNRPKTSGCFHAHDEIHFRKAIKEIDINPGHS